MRGKLTGKVHKYPLQRKAKCWVCNKPIVRDDIRWEAQLEMKNHYNPYWTNFRDNRVFELSVIICNNCKKEGQSFGLHHESFIEIEENKIESGTYQGDHK